MIKQKLQAFFYGRYGNDTLNLWLLGLSVVIILINAVIKTPLLDLLAWAMWLVSLFRCFSRNVYARNAENRKFMTITKPIRNRFRVWKRQWQDKEHRYFLCPKCAQIVRVPKGRGKIEITCPHCHTHFDKKS